MSAPQGVHPNGFTVLELLITIVIAMVVVVLLVPALKQAEMAQQKLDCGNKLKNNGLATWQYTNRHNGHFPPFFSTMEIAAGNKIKIMVMPRKNKDSGLEFFSSDNMVCPADDELGTLPVLLDDGAIQDVPHSFGYNIALPLYKASLHTLASPSSRLVLFDGTMRTDGNVGNGNGNGKGDDKGKGGGGDNGSPVQFYDSAFDYVSQTMRLRHEEKLNALFADWHVGTTATITPAMVEGH